MYIGDKPCPFPGDMRCNSSQGCIRSHQWCNNQLDCDDGSDEDYCCKHYVYDHICDQICQKGSYTHSFKIHFSSPSVSYISAPTPHVFNTAEGWTVCFNSGLFLKLVCMASTSALIAFKWCHLLLASRKLTVDHHMIGWWVWPWI